MNKKLSLIILFLLFISLISVLLAFMAFSKGSNNQDVGELKTGYEQLTKQVNELKVTTDDIGTKVNGGSTTIPSPQPTNTTPTTSTPAPQPTTPVTTVPATKTVSSANVNMRAAASTTGRVVRQLPRGEQVTPTGQTFSSGGFQWIQVKDSQGNTGWLAASFIK